MKRRVGQRLFGAALASGLLAAGTALAGGTGTVSYTHLTLPTTERV